MYKRQGVGRHVEDELAGLLSICNAVLAPTIEPREGGEHDIGRIPAQDIALTEWREVDYAFGVDARDPGDGARHHARFERRETLAVVVLLRLIEHDRRLSYCPSPEGGRQDS